ncbi:TorF family putative porin [Thiorhodococcus fuscus]|uniref:TorF family putative porin n=1 Tax=Thiorhodococcus fuscus TaxID=527200 RepID=A0ABW4Y4X7_9GAMM
MSPRFETSASPCALRPLAFGAAVLGATIGLPAQADWSTTVTAASDYLFNGVTQTGHKPALQIGLDWSAATGGFYGGLWASNVDFEDDTKLEFDGAAGYLMQLHPEITLDAGVAYYTYHGDSDSSDYNYPEVYLKLGLYGFNLNAWYSYDYFGLDVGHVILMLSKDIQINDRLSFRAQIDRSTSLDVDRYAWDDNEDSYLHWQVMGNYAYSGFDFSLGVSGTDLSYSTGDTRVLFTLSRTFSLAGGA